MQSWSSIIGAIEPAIALGLLTLAFLGDDPAWAQTSACEGYRTELASVNRSGSPRMVEANAQRQRGEIERLSGYYHSIGCDRSGFLAFFQKPAECGPIAGQIRSLQATYQVLIAQAGDFSALESRRRQLKAAVARECDGIGAADAFPAVGFKGGGRLVCVRTCDGSYFPLDGPPKAKEEAAALCSALCPNAEAILFSAPRKGGIEEAVSKTGEPYMKLPNALRYRTIRDPNCSCKKPDESWAQALRKAESLVKHRKDDVLVTEAIATQMTNAMLRRPKAKWDKAEGATTTASRTYPVTVAVPEVTGSIGRDAPSRSGPGKAIRVIAPDIIPVPLP